MNIYNKKFYWKLALLFSAILIGIASLWYTNTLVDKLREKEKANVELWHETIVAISNFSTQKDCDITPLFNIIKNNKTVPVILMDQEGNIVSHRNLDSAKLAKNEKAYLLEQLADMKAQNEPIVIPLANNHFNYIYFKDSLLLRQLKFYPLFQLSAVGIFILIAYFAFSSARKAEQNQVWVGMAKETAHQLGTPLSSLLAWLEVLKMKDVDEATINEIRKDLTRLETITERFSKIGSRPDLQSVDMGQTLTTFIDYLKTRVSQKVKFEVVSPENAVFTPINLSLFEWVIENICKNAVDAMNGEGSITLEVSDHVQFTYIDITDSGKGIPKSKFKTIFEPGYTSKKRGWGLGLSLAKRIIETYHSGKIFVKKSDPENGTTFRIVLNKQ